MRASQDAIHHADPPLTAEILSPSTRQRDLLYKRDIYEKLGVGTYLIADPDNRAVTLLRRTPEGFSESASPLIELSRRCKIELELSGIFAQL